MPPFLITSISLFIIWAALFLFSKETRREQFLMSLIGLVLAPGALMIAAADYRANVPVGMTLGIEDALFAFSLFGIAAVIYQALLGKHTSAIRGDRLRFRHPAAHWFAHLVLMLGIGAFVSLAAMFVFSLNSVQGLTIGALMVGIYVIADRKDLLLDALLSGALVAMLVFLAEQLFFVRLNPQAAADFWQVENLSGILLGGIPAEEILWAAVAGFAIGPLYEYVKRRQLN